MNPTELVKAATQYFNLRKEWLGDGERPVDKPKAQARANICIQCPKNNPTLWEHLASPIALKARRSIEVKNQMNLRVDGEKSLHVCDVCHCVMRLKIWVPEQIVQHQRQPEWNFPEHCWIEKEKKENAPP